VFLPPPPLLVTPTSRILRLFGEQGNVVGAAPSAASAGGGEQYSVEYSTPGADAGDETALTSPRLISDADEYLRSFGWSECGYRLRLLLPESESESE
jgi:hypothetical protein